MTDQLAAFAPRRVIDHDLLAAGGSWTQTATTLFVDLEGFTSLTESLGRFGSRGTEELSVLLRGFFGAATDAITDHGGDPVAFGGDALTGVFDGPSWAPALEAATGAAAEIGRLVERVSGVTTLGGPLRLRTRTGIARGSVTTGLARSSRRCLPVQLGPGLDLAAAAEATAEPGEVVVHPSARDATADTSDPGADRSGSRTEPAVLAQLASPLIVDRLTAGTAPEESHRRVTTAFARFPSFRPDEVADFLTAVGDLLERVDGWEGEVVQVSGGDKGVVAMVVFGVPLAHADDPMRAVEAMLWLRDREPAVAAGIATGPVFAALLGSRSRLFPTHTGLAVTTAARLMQLADPGDLLVDGATWAETSGRLRQRGEPSVRRLKGQRDQAMVHTVSGWHRPPPGALAGARPPLLGRRTEVAALEALLDDAAAGAGRCVVAYGEPGIGKTRLAQEAVDRARTRGFRVVATDADVHPRGRPQTFWRELLGSLVDVPAGGSAAQWHTALSARLPAAGAHVELLGLLLGLPMDEPRAGRPDVTLEIELARGLLAQLLAVVSRDRPVLVVVDNVDHLDDGARAAIGAVAERLIGSSTALLLTAAHDPPDQGDGLPLKELAAADAGVVAADAWRQAGAGTPPPWLAGEVTRRAGGNPLYVRTVVWALHDQWEPGSPPPTLTPGHEGALTALLYERVDRLPRAERELVHLLAVVRRPCAAEVLVSAAGGLQDVQAVRQVATGRAAGRLVEIRDTDGVERYRLVHDVLRRAVHDSLSHAERDRLHRHLVESLERQGADALEIGEHVRELDDPALRRVWFPRAAAAARRSWSIPDALRYLEEVRPLLTGADRERAEVELLEVRLVAGRANDVLAEAVEPGPDVDTMLAARRLHAIAEAAFVCGDFRRSEAAARRAMELTDGRDEVRYQRAAELCVLIGCETGDARDAASTADRLLARAVAARDVRATITAHAALGAALLISGRPEQAARHYGEALAGAREGGDLLTQVHVLSDLAGCAYATGDHAACTRMLAEARSLADGIGYRRHLAFNLNNEAQLRAALGDRYAAPCAATAVRRSVEMGDLANAANALHTWLTASPEFVASLDHWRRLVRLDAGLDRAVTAAADEADLSVVAARAGQTQEALHAAAAAEAAAGELDQPHLRRRARLGRLLAARPTDTRSTDALLVGLDGLLAEPGAEDVERAEIALERWRITAGEADRGSAVALARRAFDVQPSAVVRAWFDELAAPTPEPPPPLPPPVGIGGGNATLAQLDDAFTLVETTLRGRQRSE